MTQQYEKKTVEAGAGGSIPEKLDRINSNLETPHRKPRENASSTHLNGRAEAINQCVHTIRNCLNR